MGQEMLCGRYRFGRLPYRYDSSGKPRTDRIFTSDPASEIHPFNFPIVNALASKIPISSHESSVAIGFLSLAPQMEFKFGPKKKVQIW